MLARPFGFFAILALAASTIGAPQAHAAASERFSTPAVSAQLLTAENGVAPGAGFLSAGLALDLGEGWKTYWRSPGEVGFPPEIDWSRSRNVASVEFQWPAPERFSAFGIENFGYHDEVVFPLRITLDEPGASTLLSADVTLLACSDICVPQDFALSLEIPAGRGIDAASAERITAFAERVPVDGAAAGVVAANASMGPDASDLILSVRRQTPFTDPDVFPEVGPSASFGVPDIRLGEGGRWLWARLPILSAPAATLPDLSITVTDPAELAFTISPEVVLTAPSPPYSAGYNGPGLAAVFWIAATAFLGGLILNVMPCVLPVLSIKLGSALKLHGADRSAVRRSFLASAAGVMAFMWSLAALLFALRQIGVTVGWGLQFQNPVFLSAMIVLLAVFAANLAGGFEFSLPARLQTRLADAGATRGHVGDFLTGAFAAVLATPCSAPFLGTAVAFALAGRAVDIAIVFTFLGLGLAAPYLLVAARPGLIRHLPRPGGWMVLLRWLLGLLLGLTALWLIWVLGGVAGSSATLVVAATTAALVALLCAPRVRGATRAVSAIPLAILPLVFAALLADSTSVDRSVPSDASATAWMPFNRSEIARRVSAGEVVFVDVTADWCLTCKANKALVLDRDPVATALAAPGIVAMQADWTRPDDAISRYLTGFDRYGIPFNAVYGPSAPNGIVLPELLSTDVVIDALAKAGVIGGNSSAD